MLRRPFLIAVTAAALGFALPALAANPQGRVRHDRRQDPRRALSRRRAEDGREFSRLRESQALRRHAVPPRDRRVHDPGRRLHAGLQGEADAPADPDRIRAVEQGGPSEPCRIRWRWRERRDPNSATAQFFINVADNKFLNFREATQQGYGYTVFGKVISGMDVVDKIARAPTGAGGPFPKDVPAEKVVINKAVVVDAK